MKIIRILHVASFTGNIGDNANHTGFRNQLAKCFGEFCSINYDEFEIRKVFWGQEDFGEDFTNLANSYDLVVIGGGNYFELWVEDSPTGTSISISLDNLKKIDTPIVFNALGVDPAQGASEVAITKFRIFLDYAIANPKILLSCRNDGSLKTLKEIVGIKYADSFFHVPDAGFFTKVVDNFHPEIKLDRKNILIQLAGDMINVRFSKSSDRSISYEDFLSEMSLYIQSIANKCNVNFIFVPHIFRDLDVIHSLIDLLPDDIRRSRVSVAPYLTGQDGQDYIFDLYRKVDLVLGMRFHSSVCAIGQNVNCIGLVNYRQIDELYNELGLDNLKIKVNESFSSRLDFLTMKFLNDEIKIDFSILDNWENKLLIFHNEIKKLVL